MIEERIDTPSKKRSFNRSHFTVAASRYDLATRFMSLERDSAWKRRLVDALPEMDTPFCVDLACGTGDVAFLLASRYPRGQVEGVDITEAMLEIARGRNRFQNVTFSCRDMADTRVSQGSVDFITGSYALRNAPRLEDALREVFRILKPGGVAAFLEFSRPSSPLYHSMICRFLKAWGGLWGLILHGNPEIHGYVGASLATYPDAESFNILIHKQGFRLLFREWVTFGIMELMMIEKPFPVVVKGGIKVKGPHVPRSSHPRRGRGSGGTSPYMP